MRWVWLIVFVFQAHLAGADPGILPVYIEDNHAGSLGWFAWTIDLDTPHVLVLVDAHSDATAVTHSDALRDGLRRVASEAGRRQRIAGWRGAGRIQAYNWIEPLMPHPIDRVIWLAGWDLPGPAKERLRSEAGESVDGRVEFEGRAAGELADRWQVVDAAEFDRWKPPALPIVATIDLDFFAGMKPDEAVSRFKRIWTRVLDLPGLRAVSFAISRPWLNGDEEASRLLLMALNEIRLVRGARLCFEPFSQAAPDDSLRSREFAAQGIKVPAFDLETSSRDVRMWLAANGAAFKVSTGRERWNQLRERWIEEFGGCEIRADDSAQSTDGVWRVAEGALPALRVSPPNAGVATGRVRWWVLRSAANCYNLVPETSLGKGFTSAAGPWVRDDRILLAETQDGALAASAWRRELDATGWGRIRIEGEVETDQGWLATPTAELRVSSGEGFHAGLSEQFGAPYVFGIGFARDGNGNGADTGWGNDCANFLIAAWRRTGRSIPWGNPAQLRTRLRTLSEDATIDSRVVISDADVQRGVVIDFGRHVAAFWEDHDPKGVLDASDILVHHLGSVPERITLGKLAATRPRFAVRTAPDDSACRVVIGGDVVLAGTDKSAIAALRSHLRGADVAVVNLEGAAANTERAVGKLYNFSFDPKRLSWLCQAGVSAVGMANNHSADAGPDGIVEGVRNVRNAGLGSFGAGTNIEEAIRPWLVERNGVRLAFFAVSCVDAERATTTKAGVAMLPDHAVEIERALRNAKSEGRTVIVLAHWGLEYTEKVEEEQRRWARWLIDRGADVIAGAHSHVVQPLDFWRGRSVAYSLGNAVFPAPLKGSDQTGWLVLQLDRRGEVVSAVVE